MSKEGRKEVGREAGEVRGEDECRLVVGVILREKGRQEGRGQMVGV